MLSKINIRFNAARGFVGGATKTKLLMSRVCYWVSMPHAALWVVQLIKRDDGLVEVKGFNAARGFVGGAAMMTITS